MKQINFLASLLILLSISVSIAGCAPDDKKIAEHVKAGITVLDSNIQVNVKEGVVTLSGMVMDESTRNAAESAIKEIKGVKSVINNTTVKAELRGDEPDADGRLRQTIDSSFKSSNIQGIKVDIDKGEVTVSGDVKKAEMVKIIKAVNGARPKRVINRLNVK